MDSAQALHTFWSSFGWTAYDTATVPSKEQSPAIPRITYDVVQSDFGHPVVAYASLWDRSYSWETISKKADQISDFIGRGGCMVPYDDGCLWIKKNDTFAQRMPDENNEMRRIRLVIEIEYLTSK